MKRCFFLILLPLSLQTSGQFKNIMLAEQREGVYPPVEPTIVVNSRNTANIVAGIVLDRAVYSLDCGKTWSESVLQSPFGVFGDPVLVSDAKGQLYYFHLSDPSAKGRSDDGWLDRIVCQTSEDGGKTWTKGYSIGNNPPKDQDKPWAAVHPKKQIAYVTWTQFDKYGSQEPGCQSNIMFSMSTNAGSKWSKPVQINADPGDCLDNDLTAEGAVPVVDLEGRIYVTWARNGGIYLDRSYNGGETWLYNDLLVTKQEAGWTMDIPGISRCNGMPVLAIDNSPSKSHGSLYIVYADQKNGPEDTDIFFARSTNKGDYWPAPKRINRDEPGRHQFLPWMAVDQQTGHIYIVYYDRRAYEDLRTDVYLAYSFDGGNSFKEVKISETPFVPDEKFFFGDYNNISAHAGIITPIWTRMDNGKTSVWTSVIKESDLPR